MIVTPLRFTDDVDALARFYVALGLTDDHRSRTGDLVVLTGTGGMVLLHAAGIGKTDEPRTPGETALSFEATEPLEAVAARLHAAGFPEAHVVDEAYGRSLRVVDPDGIEVVVNESDLELYT